MLSSSAVATRMEASRAVTERFGLVREVRFLAAAGAVQVELGENAGMHTLLALHSVLHRPHVRAGVYTKVDEYVRLHLRGKLDDIGPVIITLPLHRARRAEQARMVWGCVTADDPLTLLDQLSALD